MPSSTPRILITAGPTHEPIDDVRYIGNRSSGKMGLALAAESAHRGWRTTLLLGPCGSTELTDVIIKGFHTTAQLRELLMDEWPKHDVLIMAAAVSDYTPSKVHQGKRPRASGPVTLSLRPTPDLLAEIAASSREDQTLIGFALESPGNLRTNGQAKRLQKGVHAIVANPLDTMDSEMIEAMLLMPHDREAAPSGRLSKIRFAAWLLDQLPMIQALQRTI